jgi:uncharacterized protein (DUF58 family)
MIVPSARMIWTVAAIGFPAAVAVALSPAARPYAETAIAAAALWICADAAMSRQALAGVRVELPELARFFKDRDAEIRVCVRNAGGSARALRVGIAAPDGIESAFEEQRVDLPAGADTGQFIWRCTPRRRGRYRIRECALEALSPLGMWEVRRREAVAIEIRVYPNLRRHDDLKALLRSSGSHARRQVGRGREFEKLREYTPGDGLDELHWKASARRGRPITKVFQVERTQEVYVIIDASRLSGRWFGDDTAIERALSAALLVGAAAQRRGDLFGLAVFANQVETFARAGNGKAHYAACRDAIYQLQTRSVSPDFDEIATFLRLRLRRRALLVFLTALDDAVIAENFVRASRLLSRRHLVVAAMLRPPAAQPLFHDSQVKSTRDIYRHLAGHLSWRRLREIEATLSRDGVRLALLEPANFGSAIAGLYDEVKQRQLL